VEEEEEEYDDESEENYDELVPLPANARRIKKNHKFTNLADEIIMSNGDAESEFTSDNQSIG